MADFSGSSVSKAINKPVMIITAFVVDFYRGCGTMIMVKQKTKMKNKKVQIRQSLLMFSAALVVGLSFVVSPLAQADRFDEQIQEIQRDSNNKRQSVNQLQIQAESYQGEIDRLQGEINAMRQQIAQNEAKLADIENQITIAQAELDKQKRLLGINIKTMYVEGEISTLEMLASSKDLSEYLDKQQYRDNVQDKIKTTLDKITALKAQLKEQKTQVEKLLSDQKAINDQLSSTQYKQSELLAYTEHQKNQFNAQIRQNGAAIADLRAQQAAANRKLGGTAEAGDPGHGGYPAYLDNAPKDALIDPWGMYNRECVSYTAWKVYERYGHMPYWGGHGNANQWPASARADNIPTGSEPRVGSVAVSMAGYYGHVMWVEAVLDNGYIRVSQYNYDLAGHYSEMTINGNGLTYIYFQ